MLINEKKAFGLFSLDYLLLYLSMEEIKDEMKCGMWAVLWLHFQISFSNKSKPQLNKISKSQIRVTLSDVSLASYEQETGIWKCNKFRWIVKMYWLIFIFLPYLSYFSQSQLFCLHNLDSPEVPKYCLLHCHNLQILKMKFLISFLIIYLSI